MINKKKELPLKILKSLEPFVNLKDEKFKVADPKNNLLSVLDIDNESGFYFKIEQYQKAKNGAFQLLMNRKPTNENQPLEYRTWIYVDFLESEFKTWLSLLEQYEAVKSFFDDPIVKSNAEKFFQKFKIIDENADVETFDLEQQLFLDKYLDDSKNKLQKLKDNQTDEQILAIETLEKEADQIKSVLTSESKNKIIIRLSKFWGRAQKTGLQVIKEIFVNVAVEIGKKLLIGQ